VDSYAQTNIQLFNQMRSEGYPDQEVARMRDVYEFALRLFPGLYQPCGKPFIDHLIGTASILAFLHRPVEVVAAGLIHAAYLHGNFGSFRRGISNAKREKVRQAVGKEIEEYIVRYTALRWTGKTISAIQDGFDALGPIDREVLLMRLANTLELYLDLGALCCCNAESYQQGIERHGALIRDMADRLGFPTLAAELARVFRETTTGGIPRELRNRSNQTRAYLIAPKSYRKRLPLAVWHQLRQLSWVQMVLQKALKVAGIQLHR
jgi:Domain of unknown function (DUF6817)